MSPVRPWPEAPCAGVAHLVERDLAKVEVASSSLVARSKNKTPPFGWCFVFGTQRAETRKGQPRSGSNSPGDCCGARVRAVGAKRRSGEPRRPLQNKKNTQRVFFLFWSELLGALVVSAVFQPTLVGLKNGTLPFFRLASSATGSASAKNSSPAQSCDEARNEF